VLLLRKELAAGTRELSNLVRCQTDDQLL
jgi:hypothetical protein